MAQIIEEDLQKERERRRSEEKASRIRLDENIDKLYKESKGIGTGLRGGKGNPLSKHEDEYKKIFGDLYYHGIKDDIEKGRLRNIDAIESFKQFRTHNPGVDTDPAKVTRWWKDNSRKFIKEPTGTPGQEERKENIGEISEVAYLDALQRLSNMKPSELEQRSRELLPQLLPQLLAEYQNPSVMTESLFPDVQDARRSLGGQFINQLIGPQALQQNVPALLSSLGNLSREDISQYTNPVTQRLGNAYETLKGVGQQGYGAAQSMGNRLLQSLQSLGK